MGEEESVNAVSKTGSNGNSMPENTLDDMTEKKNLGAEGGKTLENNGVEDLKEDGLKDMEVDKKAEGEEEIKEDKQVDDSEVVKDNKKVDGGEEVKEDKKVDCVEEMQEDKKDEGIKQIEEDKKDDFVNETGENKKDDNGFDNEKLNEETEVKETMDGKEEKEIVEAKKPELDVMDEEGIPKDKDESNEEERIQEEEGEDKVDKSKEEDKAEDIKVQKGLKKRGKGSINGEKVKRKRKELKETEPRTPAINRPVRERKSVERLVASIEKDAKEFHFEKGRGTPLKDIPNVAFKLSRRKTDDTLKFLHTVLFGRRGKAVEIKSNISRFSGFVWHENEEKQMTKVKEKFEKCNKDKLLEFCEVLDIPLAKATTRKEDIVAKLIDFLVAPQVTTTALLAENEKGKKRKRIAKRGSSRSGTTSRRSAKSRKKNEDSSVAEERKNITDTENESEEEEKEEENEEENENGVPDKSEDEMPEQSESDDKSESDHESEDVKKPRKINKTSSTKKESAAKSVIKKITFKTKSRSAPKRISKKSLSTHSESDDDSERSLKVSSRRKKNEKRGKQKTSTLTKSSSKEKTEKASKGKGKNKLNPSDDQLRDVICEILKEVDFNTATFTDILKQLAKQFNIDLTPRKASIKVIIQEELTKLAEADEDEEGDAENDETQSTGQEVEA